MIIRGLIVSCSVAGILFAACSGDTNTRLANGTLVTPADKSVCAAVKLAYTDYQVKNYSQWRSDMTAISEMKPDNQGLKDLVKTAQSELAQKGHINANTGSEPGLNLNFGPLGSFVGLRQQCKSLDQ
jgi:hypothetical protein